MTRRVRPVHLRRGAMVVLALVLLGALWELYKAVIPEDGVAIGDTLILPRSDDASMPHLADIFGAFGDSEVAGGGTVASSVADGGVVLAAAGVRRVHRRRDRRPAAGAGDAAAARSCDARSCPTSCFSQTVPLIALAPLVYGWGGEPDAVRLDWQPWMSVSVIAAYLAFFPVAIGALRGLASPSRVQTELLESYAASWWQTLLRLRLPASVPYLIPALRLAAAAAVVGAVVAEISTGLQGGIGRLIITYAQQATGDPSRRSTRRSSAPR